MSLANCVQEETRGVLLAPLELPQRGGGKDTIALGHRMYKGPPGHEDGIDKNPGKLIPMVLTWVTVRTPRTGLIRQEVSRTGMDTLGLLCLNSLVKRLEKYT